MGKYSEISWTDHTWNPWRGCTKVSAGCKNCYMYAAQNRRQVESNNSDLWNPEKVQRTKTWRDPERWHSRLRGTSIKRLVFTCSWSDFFHPDADAWRKEAWEVMWRCPNLIFQILTKRPELIRDRLPSNWGPEGYGNVWMGVSVETPEYLKRVDVLRTIPATVRFLSLEPLLAALPGLVLTGIGWVIVGGESGNKFRPMEIEWPREIRDKCHKENVPFYFKQSAGYRQGTGTQLDGQEHYNFPKVFLPLPSGHSLNLSP